MDGDHVNTLLGRPLIEQSERYDAFDHYALNVGPTDEYAGLAETRATIRNIGWTLGNDCPYRCTHCYSMNARVKGRDMSVAMVDRIVGPARHQRRRDGQSRRQRAALSPTAPTRAAPCCPISSSGWSMPASSSG